ncbi:MAG: hypothetical protein AAB739_03700, partial [Patescibacteria group bacterium]
LEVEHGTDPVNNPFDDMPIIQQPPKEIMKNEEGIFILRPSCGDVCPCRAILGPATDLQTGDTLFAGITGKGGIPIYAKSNEETY